MPLIFSLFLSIFILIFSYTALCLNSSDSPDYRLCVEMINKEVDARNAGNFAFSPTLFKTILLIIGSLIEGPEHDLIRKCCHLDESKPIELEDIFDNLDIDDTEVLSNIILYKEDAQDWINNSFQKKISQVDVSQGNFYILEKGGKAEVNYLVSSLTDGKTPSFLDSDPAKNQTVFIATKLFKGEWDKKFSSSETGTFKKHDGSRIKINFMKKNHYCKVYTGDAEDGKGKDIAIRIPYKDYNRNTDSGLVMDVIMPANHTFPYPKPGWIELLNTSGRYQDITLKMPEFNQSSTLNLTDHLKNIGLEKLLDEETAKECFKRSMRQPTFISSSKMLTTVDVDKDGTTAAAAAKVSGTSLFCGSLCRPKFIFNKPFYYCIHDPSKKGIEFCGRVNDPTQQ